MSRLVVDTARFAIDTIDGETIVMDLVGGRLYLFEGGASTLFELLAAGASVPLVEQEVENRYGERHRRDFVDFVQSLVKNQLLVDSVDEQVETLSSGKTVWPEKLGEIIVSEYDDMSSIITMDPIHDVDPEKGWPFKEVS